MPGTGRAAEAQAYLGAAVGGADELRPIGHRAHQGEADLQTVVVGRGLPDAPPVVADLDFEPVRCEGESDRERSGRISVRVLDDVIARLADRGVDIAQELGIEPENFSGGRRHAADEPRRLGPAGQLKADPWCVDFSAHNARAPGLSRAH